MTRNAPLHQQTAEALMNYRLAYARMACDGLTYEECLALLETIEREVLPKTGLCVESLEGIRAITGSTLGLRGQHPERLRQAANQRQVEHDRRELLASAAD